MSWPSSSTTTSFRMCEACVSTTQALPSTSPNKGARLPTRQQCALTQPHGRRLAAREGESSCQRPGLLSLGRTGARARRDTCSTVLCDSRGDKKKIWLRTHTRFYFVRVPITFFAARLCCCEHSKGCRWFAGCAQLVPVISTMGRAMRQMAGIFFLGVVFLLGLLTHLHFHVTTTGHEAAAALAVRDTPGIPPSLGC
jgi:hypothetical protein